MANEAFAHLEKSLKQGLSLTEYHRETLLAVQLEMQKVNKKFPYEIPPPRQPVSN